MAKASKKKKVIEEPVVVEVTETTEQDSPIIEPPIVVTPIEPLKEEVKVVEKYEPPKPVYRKELDATLSIQYRIEAFVDDRGLNGYIRLNDFLKSLYGVPAFNTPPKWTSQAAMKELGGILESMQQNNKLVINNNMHKLLGKTYYSGEDYRQSHHNLDTITIEGKK